MDCNSRRAHLCLGSSPPSLQHKGPVVNESVRNIDNPSDEADAKTSETIPQCSDIFVLRKNVNLVRQQKSLLEITSVRNFLTPKEFVVTVRFGSEHVRNLSSPSIECYAGPWATLDNTVCRAVYIFTAFGCGCLYYYNEHYFSFWQQTNRKPATGHFRATQASVSKRGQVKSH